MYRLSEDQIISYFREGYIVVRGLVPHKDIELVMECAQTQKRVTDNGADNWQYVSFDFGNPHIGFPLHTLLAHPEIITVVEQLFEAPVRVFYGMLAVVQANGSHGLPWHQDNQYQHILGKALNTFVALCDITPDKANLWVAPGSHINGLSRYKMSETFLGHRENISEPENAILLPTLSKGDVCIFNRYTLHRSLQNTTSEDRYAYAAQYCEATARCAEDGIKYSKILARDLALLFEKQALHLYHNQASAVV